MIDFRIYDNYLVHIKIKFREKEKGEKHTAVDKDFHFSPPAFPI